MLQSTYVLQNILAKVTYDNESGEKEVQARIMFEQYVQEIAQRKEGIYLISKWVH